MITRLFVGILTPAMRATEQLLEPVAPVPANAVGAMVARGSAGVVFRKSVFRRQNAAQASNRTVLGLVIAARGADYTCGFPRVNPFAVISQGNRVKEMRDNCLAV